MEKLNEGYLTTFRDEQTMTEVAYSEKGLVSYDDERAICDKTEYAMVHNLVSTSRHRFRTTPFVAEHPYSERLHHLGAQRRHDAR